MDQPRNSTAVASGQPAAIREHLERRLTPVISTCCTPVSWPRSPGKSIATALIMSPFR